MINNKNYSYRAVQSIAHNAIWFLWLAPLSVLACEELIGDWSLQMDSGIPAWMSINQTEGNWDVKMRLYVGSEGPHVNVTCANEQLRFTLRQNKKATDAKTVNVGMKNGELEGVVCTTSQDGAVHRDSFTGTKIPPVSTTPPDLAKVRFGLPIALLNGRDLTGWEAYEPDKKMGWSVQGGELVNTTPKTDFSATGEYANLRTVQKFTDFWLHAEFNIGEARNSGIYLRGMYEVQVVDRDSRMQGKQGVGAIFGKIEPTKNAGKEGGVWQTYDITLVDRHVTVILNGEKVIDNQPISGPTAGAVFTNPTKPGPIYLQGDHTSVKYRNMYLAPVIKNKM